MNTLFIGHISLNIALILYLIQYLPQLYHNKNTVNLKKMSLFFHFIFFIAYLTDLIYAFGLQMPWQYILVSIVGLTTLMVQQRQLTKIYQGVLFKMMAMVFLLLFIAALYLILIKPTHSFYIGMELVSYTGFLTFKIPQLYCNWRLKTGEALSIHYLLLSLCCTICDIISSWCLSWPWPNKVGAWILFIITNLLILQTLYYRKR